MRFLLWEKYMIFFFRLVMQEQPGGRQHQHVPKRSWHEGFYGGGGPVFGDPYSCGQGTRRVLRFGFPIFPLFVVDVHFVSRPIYL